MGYTIIDENLNIKDIDYIKLSPKKNLIDKSFFLRDKFIKINKYFSIDAIGIEDIVTKFVSGRSSIKTIITLSQFNILAQYHLKDVFNIDPTKINVLRARNLSGIKIPKGSDTKDFVLNVVKEWYADILWPQKRNGGDKKECYDMADSLVVAKALLMERLHNGNEQGKVSNS